MIDGLKPYQSMKVSGVPWLGEVPANWDVLRAKYLLREVDERSRTGSEELLSVSHKTGVTPRSEKKVTMFLAESNEGHKLCRPGDVVINTMWAWMAALGVSRHTGLVSPSYGVYRPLAGRMALDPNFVDVLLRTEVYRAEYVRRSTGVNSSRLRLYPEQFLRIPIMVPPLVEQAAIVKYLRQVDRSINRYIRAKKHLVALLDEQNQAIVHRAVKRGLEQNVTLKPSTVQWLGDLPTDWEVIRLRHVATKFGSGVTPRGGAQVYVAQGVPFLRSQNVHFSGLQLHSVAKIPREVHEEMSGTHVQPHDVLLRARP